jgi:uncharacterized membrane protein YccC
MPSFLLLLPMEVVFLLTFVEPQPLVTSADRALNTIIGGILALAIYFLWPTWEHPRVLHNIANRLEALRTYFVAVMRVYANPQKYASYDIDIVRMETRLARSNAVSSLQRSQQEPETRGTHRVDSELIEGLLIASDLLSQSVLSLEAFLADNPARHMLPEIQPFTHSVDEALHLLATSVDEEQSLGVFPDVNEAFAALERAVHIENGTRPEVRVVMTEAKSITRNVNTMKQLLVTRAKEYVQQEGQKQGVI